MQKKLTVKSAENIISYHSLNPCGYLPEIEYVPLTPRITNLNYRVLYIINSWPEHSGFEELISLIAKTVAEHFQTAKVITIDKPGPYMIDDPGLWQEIRNKADTFIYVAAPSCSTTSFAVTWTAKLEKMGVPGLVLFYETLIEDVKRAQERLGTLTRTVSVPYPPQTITPKKLSEVVDQIIANISSPLTDKEKRTGLYTPTKPKKIACSGTLSKIQDYFYEQGWTDGLPIIPPTKENVAEMLSGTSHESDEVVTTFLGPEKLIVTVEKIAINGVMAGCKPEYMPVLLASVEAFASGEYEASVRSTNSFSFLQVVNGPIRNEINMNSGTYALGPGNQANATIGRALRLFIINLGGGQIGTNIMGVQGNVTAYTFCIPENEERSPWEPFNIDMGFERKDSTVTVFNGGWSHTGNYGSMTNLDTVARDMSVFEWPNGVVVLVSPQRAELLQHSGMNKEAVKEYIWRKASTNIKEFRSNGFYKTLIEPVLNGKGGSFSTRYSWPREYLDLPDDTIVPIYPKDQIQIIVVGGDVSPLMQVWKMANPRTVSVDKWR